MSKTFQCPACAEGDMDVKDSRPRTRHIGIRRRRQCRSCGHKITTVESERLTAEGAAFSAFMNYRVGELRAKLAEVDALVALITEDLGEDI